MIQSLKLENYGGNSIKNYKTTDYAINKCSEVIVYRFDDKIVEVTLEQYLVENPTKTEEDYKRLKAISDDIYLVQTEQIMPKRKRMYPSTLLRK